MVNWDPDGFDGIDVAYDVASATAIVSFETGEVPSCTLRVVRALHAAYDAIVAAKKRCVLIDQMILTSHVDGIFNMGGDLGLMSAAARAGDDAALRDYGRLTASLVHRTWNGLGVGLTTIAAVDGDAFGGGCEAALSANVVVATARSRFAFPEVRFGLYPAMGATSLLGRRVSPAFATDWITNGQALDAERAERFGFVDRIISTEPDQSILRFFRRHPSSRRRLRELARLRRIHAGYTLCEAEQIVLQWAATVAAMPQRKLTQIERIVKAQKAKMIASAHHLDPR